MKAQSAVEYGLLLATLAVGVLLAAGWFGESLRRWFDALALHVTNH